MIKDKEVHICDVHGCGNGMRDPTPRQILEGVWECECGYLNHFRNSEHLKHELILELFERVEDLEEKLDDLI